MTSKSMDPSEKAKSGDEPVIVASASASASNQRQKAGTSEDCSSQNQTSKYLGVQRIKGSYAAILSVDGVKVLETPLCLGKFEKEDIAARAYDLACLKLRGRTVQTNFPLRDYVEQMKLMANMSEEDVLKAILKLSKGTINFGKSKFRGVTFNKKSGKWQARYRRGRKCHLGTYETEKEAAMAFDFACIKDKGYTAVTNFHHNHYNVEAIVKSCKAGKPLLTPESGLLKPVAIAPVALSVGDDPQALWLKYLRSEGKNFRIRELENPKNVEFQHGTSSPFCSYQEMLQTKPPGWKQNGGSGFFGFRHAKSSAFQVYKKPNPGELRIINPESYSSSYPYSAMFIIYTWPPYQINYLQGQDLRGVGLGFQHGNSSAFKP